MLKKDYSVSNTTYYKQW